MKGFTLIEMLIVIGIMAIIASAGIPVVLNLYRDYRMNSEVRLLSSVLERARDKAMNNFNGSAHGVFIGSDNYVIFEGDDYETRNTSQDLIVPRAGAIAISGASELVFEQLSGRTSSTTLILNDGINQNFIYINEEGKIHYK